MIVINKMHSALLIFVSVTRDARFFCLRCA
jgi:hypothetical protein